MTTFRPFALVGLAVALVACGRAASPESFAPPSRTFQALVVGAPDAEGNRVTTLYDSASGRALTTPVPQNGVEPRFGRAGRIAYLLPSGVMSVDPASGSQRAETLDGALLASGQAWSTAGSLAYLASPAGARSGSQSELAIRAARGGEVTVLLPAVAGAPQLRFSPDGRLVLLAGATGLEVLRLDGSLAVALPTSAGLTPSDATWAGDGTLYYRDARGVDAVDPVTGATRTVLPGVRWYAPDASPDGRHIVFETRDTQGLPRLELLDTLTGQLVKDFSLVGASHARFVSSTEIWFHEEVLCDGCGALTSAASEILRYDLVHGTERTTGLDGFVRDIRSTAA